MDYVQEYETTVAWFDLMPDFFQSTQDKLDEVTTIRTDSSGELLSIAVERA